MDESQQYGNYHEIAALAAIQQPMLTVFIGDHRQTPGGLSKGRAAAVNRRKLLQRPLGLRALDKSGDYFPPARMAALVAQLWPDAKPRSGVRALQSAETCQQAAQWPMDIHSAGLRAACCPQAGVPLPNFVPVGCTQRPHCSGARSLDDCHSTRGVWRT